MKVPYFDLSQQTAALRPEIDAAIKRVLDSGVFVLGPEVEAFEHEFAAYIGVRHAVAVNSGTAALHLALLGSGIKPGDRVVVPAMSFVATAEAVSHCGAEPVFCDIDPDTLNLDPNKVKEILDRKEVEAILPVHLYGQPADMLAQNRLGVSHYLPVIEDACQAHGAAVMRRRCGSVSNAAAFSFYPGKNLGAFGEGGMLTTNLDGVADFARKARAHGAPIPYQHDVVGYNYRMDALQAAVLRVKLPHLERWNERRAEIADHYRSVFANLPGLKLQADPSQNWGSNHLFVVQYAFPKALQSYLAAAGIGTSRHYPVPLHLTPAYAHLGYKRGDFPNAERLADQCVSLPIWPEMTDEQVDIVIDAVVDFSEGNKH